MIDILWIVAFLWLAAASVTDIKKREVADWLSFSLLSIALAVRSAQSIAQWDYHPILMSLAGLAFFFIIANALYYGRLFAGGDAKLMIALGAVIPSADLISNLLVIGSVYGIAYSLVLAILNRKAVMIELRKYKNYMLISFFLFLLFLSGYLFTYNPLLLLITIMIIAVPGLFFFVNAVEKSSLIKKVPASGLTEGDWLFKDIRIKGKVIKANFEGLTKKEIALIKKARLNVYIKEGIPFIPVFFLAFVVTAVVGNLFLIFL